MYFIIVVGNFSEWNFARKRIKQIVASTKHPCLCAFVMEMSDINWLVTTWLCLHSAMDGWTCELSSSTSPRTIAALTSDERCMVNDFFHETVHRLQWVPQHLSNSSSAIELVANGTKRIAEHCRCIVFAFTIPSSIIICMAFASAKCRNHKFQLHYRHVKRNTFFVQLYDWLQAPFGSLGSIRP